MKILRLATVVTAYYPISSKFPAEQYIHWIASFWGNTNCPLVFFTDPHLVPFFTHLLSKRRGPLQIVPLPFHDLAAYKKLAPEVWNIAKRRDTEIGTNHTPELYAIWYEKKEFVRRAIEMDPFKSEKFVWVDAGICRYPQWISSVNMSFPLEIKIVAGKMTVLKINDFIEDDHIPDKADGIKGNFGIRNLLGAGILASDRKGWDAWIKSYDAMLMRYHTAGRFIGKDQNIIASMALEQPELFELVTPHPSFDPVQKWFFLLFYLADVSF